VRLKDWTLAFLIWTIVALAVGIGLLVSPAGAVVSTTGVYVSYTGNGAVSSYSYPNYVFEAPDLVVTTTLAGVVTAYNLGAQPGFTFTGSQDTYGAYPSGGNVNFVDASGNPANVANNASVLISRSTPKTQIVTFYDNMPLAASVLEHAYDKLTLIAQEQTAFIAFANGSPVNSSGQTLGCSLGQWYQNATPSAGSNFGWVCTTPGVAGSAVWSPFGLVSQ